MVEILLKPMVVRAAPPRNASGVDSSGVTRQRLLAPALATVALTAACASEAIISLPGEPLNPNEYRAHIVAIDAIVFQDSALATSARDSLEKALLDVSEAAAKVPANPGAVALQAKTRTMASMARRTASRASLKGSQRPGAEPAKAREAAAQIK